jgi:hypothetical protein
VESIPVTLINCGFFFEESAYNGGKKNFSFWEMDMTYFRDFNFPLWEIFGGNLLMVVTVIFYVTWWTVSFRPGGSGEKSAGAMFFIAATLLTGLVAVALLCHAVYSLSEVGKGFPLLMTVAGTAAFYFLIMWATRDAFHREVTSELLIITVWAALEGSLVAVLYTSGRFSMAQVMPPAILLALATVIGLVCYLLHYRLKEPLAFWNGLVPLIVDGIVVAVFAVLLAIS